MMFSPQRKKLHKNIVSFLLIFSLTSGLFYAPISPVNTITEVNAAVAANGNLFYGYTTSAGLLVTRDITASDTYATAFTESAAGSASGITFVRAEYSPTRNEALVGSLKVDGRLDVHTCVGDCNAQADLVDQFGKTGVSTTSTCNTTAGGCTRPFDLAYEQLSGDAMVVFIDTASDGTIKYCTYDGSAWTPSTCGTPSSYTFNAGSTVDAKWVRLVPYQVGMKGARSDEMMMVVVDTNNDIFAARWDGSNWGNLTTITTTATTSNTQVFDVAWEESTGDAMVVWGEGTTASTQPARYKKWTRSNTTWDVSGTSLPVQTGTHLVNWVAMAGAPTDGKNHIAVFLQTATTAGNNCSTAANCSAVPYIWDGSNMTKGTQWASTESTLQRGIDVAIESLNTIVNAFFVSSLGSTADQTGYETWIEGTGFAGGDTDNLAGTTGDMGDDADGIVIKSHPGSNDIQILGRNIDDSVQQHRWDGSATKAAGWQTLVSATIAPGAVTANANGPEGQAWNVAMRPYSPWSRNWRFYDGTDTAATPTTALAAENTTPTNFDPATGKTRLRFSVQELSAHAQTDGRKKLQFTTDSPDSLSATWTDVDDVGGSAVWRYVDCDGGAATCNDNNTLAGTVLSGSPTAGWSTLDKDAAAGTNMDHSASQLRELEYSIEANGAVGETTYYFRMYDVDQMTPVFREQDNDGSNDCATAVCTYPSITTGKRTILGDGTDGLNVTIYPGHSEQEVGRFSLRTSNGTDTVNAMTVTLGGGANAYQNIATVDVQTTTSSSWTQQTNSGSRGWKSSMVSSYDGTKLAGAVAGGYIYTSTDGGVNWTQQTNSGARFWYDITSSADGTRLAAVESGGYIYTSIDGGITWVEQTNSGVRSWTAIASSADGMKLAAAVYGGYIYTSTDGGATWTQQTNSGSRYWTGIASSANGSKLAAPSENQYIYTSTDSGANWTQQNNSGIRIWGDIASSSDGTKLVAVETNGYLYTSTDSGANWTTQTGAGSQQWRDVASSADGSIIVAVPYAEYVYISENSGANWTQQTSAGSRQWEGTASSADGRKLVASVYPGYIYTYAPAASTSKCSLTPSSNTVNLTGCNISVTSTPTEYKIMITPKTHANMPAVPGASYDVTATVTSVTATNTVAGTDTDSATVTIDNLSPNNSTSTSGTAGTGAVTLNWTASNSADISQSVVLRWAASTPGAEVPVEGSIYTAGNTITTATVACVLSSTTSQAHSSVVDGTGGTTGCTTSALTNGQAYSYKVFSKDIYGNYDAGVTFTGSPFTPVAPFTISGTSSGLSDGTIVRVAIGGSLDANTTATISSNVWSFNPTGADPTTGQSVVVFATDVDGDITDNLEAVAVSKYDGSGDMSGVSLVPGTLSIGSANSQSVSLSDIDDYTCSSDEDVMHSVSANVLNLQGCSNSYSDETLSVLGSNTLTVATAETITTEKINNAGTITASGSPTFNIDGTSGTLFTNSGTFTQATSTVNLRGNGDATINSGSPTFYNLTSSGTGTKTLGAGITIAASGTLTISNGTFDPSTYTVTSNNSGQTLAVSSGATLNVGASTFAGSYPGGWTNRNLNANSTVDYNLAGTQTVDGTLTYGNVTISGSGTKSITQSTTIAGTLTVSGGTFDTTSQTLSVGKIVVNGGTFTPEASSVNVTGNSGTLITISSGTFTPFSVGTLTLSGNGDATINSGSPTFYHLISSGTGTKTLGANISVNGNLTVQGGGIFDPSTYTVGMIGGTVSNTDSTIRINGTTASGSFNGNSAASRSGTTYVQYARSGDQTVSSSSGYRFGDNLITSGSGIKTMGGSLSFETVQVGGSTTLALGSTTLTLNGTSGTLFTNNGSINSGTGTVKITSDSVATLFSGDFTGGNALYNLELSPALGSSRTYSGGALGGIVVANNFLIAPTGGSSRVLTYNMGGDNIVVGTLTIAPAVATQAVVSTTASDHITTLGYLNIGVGGTFNANGSSVSLTGTSGTLLTNNGTFTPGTSTLVLSGNGDASINTTTPLTLHNLTISSTGTKKGVGPLTIGGNLNINNANGAFHNGGQNLSVTGNITNSGLLTVAPVTEGWEYYRTITVDKTKVPSTQTDFPVLVSGTYTYLKTTENGGKVRHTNGYDVAFFADQALTQPLKFERETWSATTGAVNYWVKIPAVSHLVDTVIYMAYGNTTVTTDLSDPTNVWDTNFKGVWHLPDGTALTTNDSTINTNNATNTGVSAVSGKVGGGAGIIDSADKLTITDISVSGVDYTISTWFKMPLATDGSAWNTLTRGINNDHQIIVQRADGHLGMYDNGGGTAFNTSGYDMDGLSNGWHHLVARTSGTTTLFYIDGSYVGTANKKSNAEITTLGNYQLDTQPWGEIDELRISTGVSRSADWITTEYNNQNSPSTFYAVGNEATPISSSATITGTVTNSGTFNMATTDGDALAFLRATGITDPVISKAVGDLVTSAKLHGWWQKTDAIYPFVGGTADTHKYNLKDPRDADAAFRLTFNGGWTHDATGSDPNGTTGYAETNLVPSSVLSTNDLHVSYYSKQAAPSSSIAYEIGAMNNTTQELGLITRRTGDAYYSIMFDEGNSLINGTHTDGEGFFMGSRTSSTSHNLYKDGVSMGSNNTANSGSLPTHEIYLAGLNLNGGLYGPSDKKVAFATIGDGINSTLAQRMYLDIEKFRDAVDRNDADSSITGPVISIAGTGTPWNNTGNVIAGNSTIKITDTGAETKTFAGGGDTYNNLWFTGGAGGGGYIVSGNNTFNDFKDDGTVTHSLAFTSDSTQTMKTFSVSGANASNRITITSTGANNHNLIKTGTRDIESDFLVIEKSVALPSGDWYAGTSSVNNNSAGSGWRFNTPGGARKGGGGSAGGESSGGGQVDTGGAGTCSDGIQNGNETGIDTGGRCATGGGGGGAGGEGSGGGQGQTGGEGTCSDGIQNGNETGIDTGGRCATGGGGGDVGSITKPSHFASAYAPFSQVYAVAFAFKLFSWIL